MDLRIGATELAEGLARGAFAASDLMAATLDQIAALNGAANALVSLRDPDVLMAEARAADDGPKAGPLHGLPMAIKDLANVAGMPTSMGSQAFAGKVSGTSDPHVARLQAAGGIVIGKTNTPEFGLGSHTFNPVFGTTENAMLPGKSAGGSSGGAAVALALGMTAVADGSDMMGSLRNPAGWNGIYGLRPSWGLVPSAPEGDLYLHPLSTNGPMGRTVDDIAMLLEVMAGPDHRLPLGHDLRTRGERGLRIAWLGDWGGAYPMEAGVLDHAVESLARLGDAGCEIEAVQPPFDAGALWEAWVTLRSWAVAQKLGPLFDAKPGTLKPEAIWEIEKGRGLTAADIARASAIRSDWYRAAARLFENYDACVLPTAQCWPFPMEWDWPQTIAGVTMDTYHRWMEVVIPASLIGLPSLAVPTNRAMGLQILGPMRNDLNLLHIGKLWEVVRG